MNLYGAIQLVLSLIAEIKKYLILAQKKKIIKAKDDALKSGDQRELEARISDDDSDDFGFVSVDKYNGMYEREVKKKP